MTIEWLRDLIIIISGIISIIVIIGLLVVFFISYFKVRRAIRRTARIFKTINGYIVFLRNVARGFNRVTAIFKNGGG